MVEGLPIGPDGIHRAAEEMVAEYGPKALSIAKERARGLRSEGFESVANSWDLICNVIRKLDGEFDALEPSPKEKPPDRSRFLLSPMPGLLVSVAVVPGQEVQAGEELAVVEAMKLHNVLHAERKGVIAKLHAEPGASLAVNQAILEFEFP